MSLEAIGNSAQLTPMKLISISTAIAITLSITSCDTNKNSERTDSEFSKESQSSTLRQKEIANKVIDSMKEFTTLITKISDTKSASEAANRINQIGDEFSTYAEELNQLTPIGIESRQAIALKMKAREAEMEKALGKFFQQAVQSLTPDSRRLVEKSFKEFYEKMKVVGPEFDRHFKT